MSKPHKPGLGHTAAVDADADFRPAGHLSEHAADAGDLHAQEDGLRRVESRLVKPVASDRGCAARFVSHSMDNEFFLPGEELARPPIFQPW
jgi:hypothetical protein